MTADYEDAMNFVALHYFNNPRKGKFWEHVYKNFKNTDKLSEIATNYKMNYTPTVMWDEGCQFFPRNTEIFAEMNWKLWLNTTGIKTATPKLEKERAMSLLEKMVSDDNDWTNPGMFNRDWGNR